MTETGDSGKNSRPAGGRSRVDRWRRTAGLFLGPAAAILVLLLPFPALSTEAHRLAAVALLVVIFWLTEAVPIPVTALMGVALAVVFGIAPASRVLSAFGDQIIFLFIGSFILARAMQRHGVDRRIAYALLAHPWVGGSTFRTVWALGLTAWLLSMWISNTASVAMLFPVAIAIARTTGALMNPGSAETDATPRLRYTTGMLLMLAFAGSVGGLATPIGTPPNLIGIALIDQGLKVRIGFFQWMLFGLPVALVMLGVIYGVILALYRPEVRYVPGQLERMRSAQRELGPWTAGQINCVAAFGAAVVLWIAPGLLSLALGAGHPLTMLVSERLTEGTVALLAASLLFILPADWGRREFTLEWEEAALIDWGTVLLFGGGIALGRLIFETGLAVAMGDGILALFGAESPSVLSAAAVLLAAMISEASSNTASASTVVPVMLSIGKSAGQAPISVALAATLGSSLGFMLPVSTPPNAIVYGSGAIRITDMVKAGLIIDLAGVLTVWAAAVWLIPLAVRVG